MPVENNLNIKLEALLSDSRNEMLERKQIILFGIDSQVMEAKKDIRHHIAHVVKVQSALSNPTTH